MPSRAPLSGSLPGTWLLESRIDLVPVGPAPSGAISGEDPVALLIYDRAGHFAAQFMKRDRSAVVPDGPGGARNNSRAQGGYDAYFGTYTVDDAASTVTQRLLGALSQENVDSILTREMEVRGDTLVIRVRPRPQTVLPSPELLRGIGWGRPAAEQPRNIPLHREDVWNRCRGRNSGTSSKALGGGVSSRSRGGRHHDGEQNSVP